MKYLKYSLIFLGAVEIAFGMCIWTGNFKPSVFNQGLTWIIYGLALFLLYAYARLCDDYSGMVKGYSKMVDDDTKIIKELLDEKYGRTESR